MLTVYSSISVHPRVCGEQAGRHADYRVQIGSSPRVRGTGRSILLPMTGSRFIPACAGNRIERPRVSTTDPVHPRVCGEQQIALKKRGLASGSSPRVRGTAVGSSLAPAIKRFIPACAGNSLRKKDEPEPVPVHPRVCGEQTGHRIRAGTQIGSSPRVRGTAAKISAPGPTLRFIPACAGNSAITLSCPPNVAVHPRVCGEQLTDCLATSFSTGSSPRVRGTARSGRVR